MADNFESFPLDQILRFIQDFGWENFHVSMQDLKQPTAQLVQTLYFNLLQEFGFSDTLLQTSFDVIEDQEYPEIYKDILPVLSLQAACTYVFTRLMGDTTFGIMDLQNPSAKRTHKFISVLQNFWMFCNMNHPKVQEINEKVDELVKVKEDNVRKIEEYKKKINILRSKAVEEKEEEESLQQDIVQLNEELKNMMPRQKSLNDRYTELKDELEKLKMHTSELMATSKKLEQEKMNLEGAVEGAAMLEKLSNQLEQLNEDIAVKQKRKLECRNSSEHFKR